METICTYLKANLDQVMVEWNALAAEEPWLELPDHHRLDSLPSVVIDLVETAICDPKELDAHRKKVMDAVDHGRSRREVGFDHELIFEEYYLLRNAIWEVMRREFGDRNSTWGAMLRIDSALNIAQRASLLGYHAEEYAAAEPWEDRLERLVRDSPLLRLP